jgi:hypothetical protein
LLKGFAHSGTESSKAAADINEIVTNSFMVCRNAYKYVSELKTFLGSLPQIKVFSGDLGQVIVNLVVNPLITIYGLQIDTTSNAVRRESKEGEMVR